VLAHFLVDSTKGAISLALTSGGDNYLLIREHFEKPGLFTEINNIDTLEVDMRETVETKHLKRILPKCKHAGIPEKDMHSIKVKFNVKQKKITSDRWPLYFTRVFSLPLPLSPSLSLALPSSTL
jgi:hypothetical protein